ncbi:hemerythrin family protein [Sulfurovum sp. XGS-02]|uniref:bacteriohemerythrin n=1 Tax=Sulfurovum sp. XGS-02 TaxID=2925411 RepID=UPI00204E6534|nr:hemerythrin family protein [Sulfurovum sp. XGS-02]UPT78009.1 hemerythrin family protein [Sulfurovum sp. XGS-02]
MLIEYDEIPQVEMDFMNEVHKEDVDIINSIFEQILAYDGSEKSAAAIDELYTQWIDHTVNHFQNEEIKMQEMHFPPYLAHKGEHDRALQEMRDLFSHWKQHRDIKALKIYFIETLPAWLHNHISTMDTVTARFFATGQSPCGGGVC